MAKKGPSDHNERQGMQALSSAQSGIESTADLCYGFRRKRSCHDAIEGVALSRNDSATYWKVTLKMWTISVILDHQQHPD
jgi:hypothetical protein